MADGTQQQDTLDFAPSRPAAPIPTRATAPALVARVQAALAAMRPLQWTKNGLVLLALVFSQRLTDLGAIGRVMLAFWAFCFAASAVYIVNDIADRERDRLHPEKRLRPIAAGRLSVRAAAITAGLCLAASAALTYWLVVRALPGQPDPFSGWGGSPPLFTLTLLAYLGVNAAYSLWLKHQVLWDIFIIAAGFVFRALAGAFAIPVPISPWFYLSTTFLALLLALGKRRAELLLLSDGAADHRGNLRHYTLQLLDQLMAVVVTCTLITYSLYTFQGEGASHGLMITIPFVIFGVFRYFYLVYVTGAGQRPDELLWRDRQILGAVVLCVVVILALLYGVPLLRG